MKISEAFDLCRNEHLTFKVRAVRILETHEYVKRTLIAIIGDKKINKLTLSDISKWKDEELKTKCLNTFRNELTRLREVLRYLSLRDIECLKVDLLPVPKRTDSVPTFLSADEVAKMIESAYSLRNKFIVSLLYSSGIRLSELLQLNRNQIRNQRFTVIGKGSKARLCFIDRRTDVLMKRYLSRRKDSSPALVVSRSHHNRMTATNVQLLVKNSAKRAGIHKKVTPHTLRHSFATNFLQNNGNIRYCQEMLGHASVETTMKYTHVTNTDLEKQYNQFHSI